MRLTYVYGNTGEPGSPRIFSTDRGTVGVQGYRIDDESKATAQPPCPDPEDIVEIPADLIHKASVALRELGL